MSGLFTPTEQGLLDYFVATYGTPTKYIGLSSTLPTRAGTNITEPAVGVGSYARVPTTAADWAAALAGAPATKTNTARKTFPQATADWLAGAAMVAFVLFTAPDGGAPLASGQLRDADGAPEPKPVLLGDTPSFAPGALVLKLGAVGDPF